MSWRRAKEKHRRRRRLQPFEYAFAAVLLLCALFVAWNLWAILVGGIPHLGRALASAETRFALRLSLITTTVSSLLCMAMAIPSAYCITSAPLPGRRFLRTLVELPMSLPYLVLGLALLTVFSSPFGKALKEAGLRIVFAPKGIVAAHLLVNLPFVVHLVSDAFERLDPELALTAQTQGATRFQAFRYITLPLCRPALVSAFLLAWSRGLGEFGATLMLVGVTRMKTETLPASIYLNISTGDNGMALATAVLLLFLSLAAQGVGRLAGGKGAEFP